MVNNMDQDQTAPWSSLVKVHSVCLRDKILSEVHLNICSRHQDKILACLEVVFFFILLL